MKDSAAVTKAHIDMYGDKGQSSLKEWIDKSISGTVPIELVQKVLDALEAITFRRAFSEVCVSDTVCVCECVCMYVCACACFACACVCASARV